ncbi:MAG: SDR family NAD(P)-dependent oxidoreductase [Campylobacteraceae bacterium]|jgi:short-subunit dehydrogenase|nr:SDR family NAD(P)-dependent oxidoreductase [Campylobacteraceae bacterium]MBT3881978.1 SDR family NAD(P)-dependent oxidoreductase [Campylobacteraceae bacterium]MBT4029963.1 SDR family NAD(P)-dependent oxidoreductase [Campylobacteraceae bacterium]MBT4179445.1 SDR family NAD(P)-dependent oxidoreductase [Campylobacteraceae bacterium]MBT4572284.1 SDR family NAD(P)-dependent oxidoreductase [Campylobacteraceae bacterium]
MTTKKQTILITGCSTGIGLESALYMQRNGFDVYATAREKKDIENLKELGLNCLLLDVTKPDTIKDCLDEVLKQTNGTLDILFNNAGFGQPGAVEDLTTQTLKDQFETNVFGLHEVTIQVLSIMKAQGYGKIINHSSVLGLVSLKLRGAYNASKYAIEGLSDTLRLELEDTDISVSLLNTGPIISEFRNNAKKKVEENIDINNSRFKESYIKSLKANKSDVPFTLKSDAVAKVVFKIANTNNPAPRYYITNATYLLGYLKRILSTKMLDKILIKI